MRADVVRQYYERSADDMVAALTELEADYLLRLDVVDKLRASLR